MPLLSLEGITRFYFESGVLANDNVTFRLNKGEIHALVGENGAGKTTLMKILYGLEKKDTGKLYFKGKEIEIHSPQDANRLGIGMVRQHFRLIDEFSVAQNCVLGMEPVKKGIFFDNGKALALVNRVIDENGFDLNGSDKVGSLPVGKQQQAAIVRMLCRNDEILILDEPTAVLTERQRDNLFKTLNKLKYKGKSVILITHKIYEIKRIADRVTVMRKGRIEGVYHNTDVDESTLSRLILGHDFNRGTAPAPGSKNTGTRGESIQEELPVLVMKDVVLFPSGTHKPLLENINLEVKRGEIVGVAGVSGNGLSELEDVVSGLIPLTSGSITLNGRDATSLSTAGRRSAGAAYVPADRMRRGVSLDASVLENMIIVRRSEFFKRGIFLKKDAYAYTRKLLSRFVIAGEPDIPVRNLSGGNIQKVILSRELSVDSDFIMFSQPAWGLDVSSSKFVHDRIALLRERKKGILLISTDLDEILELSTKIVVLYQGRVTGTFTNDAFLTKEFIGDYMLGVAGNGN
ncbi:MAG: ABC transporter ATP-binding protein [Spirochaetes bacterium]|nr:MAG: ABC transporter ATP-binding protein [Spirochaetota bacterium]